MARTPHPLRIYLADVDESVSDFGARVGASRQSLYRIMSGGQTPKPALARRIVEATGGVVTFDALFGGPGKGSAKFLSIAGGQDAPELDRDRLKIAISIVVNHVTPEASDPPPDDAVEIAAEAAANTHAALAPVTTRQGAARLRQALRPVLEEILQEFSDPPPTAHSLDGAADLATQLYYQSWRLDPPA
ncbi:MAG: hypothetical protein AAGD92_12690 [Pseudomonadota bacterium]